MTLRDDLIPVVDDARSILADLGMRRHTVVLRRRTWSGGVVGSGSTTDLDLELTPAPKVIDLGTRISLSLPSLYEFGDKRVEKISATYSSSTLNPTLEAGQELIWLIDDEAHRALTRPEQLNFQWRVVIRPQGQLGTAVTVTWKQLGQSSYDPGSGTVSHSEESSTPQVWLSPITIESKGAQVGDLRVLVPCTTLTPKVGDRFLSGTDTWSVYKTETYPLSTYTVAWARRMVS